MQVDSRTIYWKGRKQKRAWQLQTIQHNYSCINNDPTYLPPGSVDAIYGLGNGARGHRSEVGNATQLPPCRNQNHTIAAANARAAFTKYLMNEGSDDWQLDYICGRANRA